MKTKKEKTPTGYDCFNFDRCRGKVKNYRNQVPALYCDPCRNKAKQVSVK